MAVTVPARGCPADMGFDPLSPEFLADPYVVMAALPLADAPVFYAPSMGYYVVTRHADIDEVFRDPGTYSAAVAQAPLAPLVAEAQQILLAGGHRPQPSMVSLDEPDHARLRKPAARAFSMKRVSAMIPAIEATTAALLDDVGDAKEFDPIGALAFPLPANIVAKSRQPGDDLTSDLLAIHAEAPERLTLDEISSILFSLSFAGHETTTGLIGNSVRRLLEDPRRWAAVMDRPCSTGQISSTCIARPWTSTWPLVRACTTASARTWASSKPRSPCAISPAVTPACN